MYSSEKNIQILIALLKAHGVKKIIASPGTTNMSLVGSLQNDSWFEMYSSVDERSAAYIACGMAAESGEPVMLTCTGATASRNYYPGLTEAYYRKLPVLAVTSHQGEERIGQLIPQNVDRRVLANDMARYAVQIPVVNSERDENFAVREINNALLELTRNGGGPVHLNMVTTYSTDFSIETLPEVRIIRRLMAWDQKPEISKGKSIVVFAGSHTKFTENETSLIDKFCGKYDAVVICDQTSGYYGRYKVCPAIAMQQKHKHWPWMAPDLTIHIGEVCAAEYAWAFTTKEVWRVNEDGEIRDTFNKLTKVFEMPVAEFFSYYSDGGKDKHELYDKYLEVIRDLYERIPDLPYSNIWNVSQLSSRIPKGSLLHISASHTRRCWNMFPLSEDVECSSNVGCCGIDGSNSSILGASLLNPNRLCFLATGDLAFFYDINTLGNRHVGKNLRILLVNNGIGAEFKLKPHKCTSVGDAANPFMAAEGHFGNKSPYLVKHYAEDLGYQYLSASNKEEYLAALDTFVNPVIGDKPIIFELFTNHVYEDVALQMMRNLIDAPKQPMKDAVKAVVGETGLNVLRKIIKKK